MSGIYKLLKQMSQTTDLVSCKTDNIHEIFCYTKAAFFGGNWNDALKRARGLLFRDGVQINEPFNKIFNLDEQPETSSDAVFEMLRNEHYELMDKSNGHLFIISAYRWKGGVEFVYSTKGSLPNPDNELLNADIEIFDRLYREKAEAYLTNEIRSNNLDFATVCTEALVQHDKHTLYDLQTEQYGEDTFVVLGAKYGCMNGRVIEQPKQSLRKIAEGMELPVVHFYGVNSEPHRFIRSGDLRLLFDYKDIEGFVIWFPKHNFRLKVKTKEYWALRFKKDLTPEKVLKVFEKGGYDRIRMKLPEEVSEQIISLLGRGLQYWMIYELIDSPSLTFDQMNREGKDLFTSEDLTIHQKQYIKLGGEAFLETLPQRKELRKEFVEFTFNNSIDEFERKLNEIVEEM